MLTQIEKPWFEWSARDVAEFVRVNKSEQIKYTAIIFKNQIDGRFLSQCSALKLADLGFDEQDAKDILRAFERKYYTEWQSFG